MPLILALLLALPVYAGERSAAAVMAFKRANECPSTGLRRGSCKGWEIDHVTPLKCGGADVPGNMQWLTVEDHRAKTKREAKWCRKASFLKESELPRQHP